MKKTSQEHRKINFDIGGRLYRWRASCNLTQEQLLAELSLYGDVIETSTYSRYESGTVEIPVTFLNKLHVAFSTKIDINYIVTGERIPSKTHIDALQEISGIVAKALSETIIA